MTFPETLPFVLLISSAFYAILVWYYACRSNASIFHPLTYYLFFHGLVFVIRPWFVYFQNLTGIYYLYRFSPDENIQLLSILVANLGLVSFLATSLIVGSAPMRFAPAHMTPEQNKLAKRSLLIAFAICLPLIIVSMRYQLGLNGEVTRERDVATQILVNTNTNGYIIDANIMLGPLACVIAWMFRFRLLALAPLAGFVSYRMYLGWGRWTFLMAVAAAVLMTLYNGRAKWLRIWVVILGIAVVGVFNMLGNNRDVLKDLVSGGEPQRIMAPPRDPAPFFQSMDFANLEYLQYILWVVPEKSGTYDYFLNNLQVLTEPIPRVLWPGKPIGAPIQLFNFFDYGFPIGFTLSLPGQGWVQLGLLGVIIWCAFGGALWGAIYRWYVSRPQTVFRTAFYCCLVPLSIQWFRDGILLSLLKFPLFFVLPLVVWWVTFRTLGFLAPHRPSSVARRAPQAVLSSLDPRGTNRH